MVCMFLSVGRMIWNDNLLPSLILGQMELYTLPLFPFEFFNIFVAK
jgi:hypothetical protein